MFSAVMRQLVSSAFSVHLSETPDLDGLGRVGKALLHVVQQHPSEAQLVVFVQQPQQSFLVLQVVLGLEAVCPVAHLDFGVVDQSLGVKRQRIQSEWP